MNRKTIRQNVFASAIICCATLSILSACGSGQEERHPGQSVRTAEPSISPDTEITVQEAPASLADVRRPDVKVHARRGQTLSLRTAGLTLTAVEAVQHEADYSVTSLKDGELPPLPQGMVNMTASAAGYRLLPGGEHFLPCAELRVAYDPERLPRGYTPDDIYTSYYDSTTLAWVRLERVGVDTDSREIVSLTTHFTDFVNELLKAPEMPETQAFVPTQISGMEAANPLAGYTTMTPPEANNMGTANLSYPFLLPAGRGGVQPNLALAYNSNGGNGLCGVGWDLPVPCISVETRWGVPLYDPNLETETYLFNGDQLIVSHDSVPAFAKAPVQRNPNEYTKRFYPRVEGAFDSILRHGTTPHTYWWEVYDRSGTCYIYGLGDGELLSYSDHGIAKWYLTRVIDRNGNTARYQYNAYNDGGDGKTSGTAMYLDKIVYTAPDGGFTPHSWYGYCVQFYYGDREDPVISGSHGLKENICKRLDSVKTWLVKVKPVTVDSIGDPSILKPEHDRELKKFESEINEKRLVTARLLNADSYIQTDSSLIRGYRLLYRYSKTGKSLLSAAVEMNSREWFSNARNVTLGNLGNDCTLKYHQFKYQSINQTTFGDEQILHTKAYMASSGLDEFYPSPLGGSREWKSGFSFNVSVGFDLNAWLRTANLEVTGSVSPKSTSHGTTALIDINGDGYPDLFYKDTSGTWKCQLYIPDTMTASGIGGYRKPTHAVVPTDEFSATVTKDSYSIGLGAHAGHENYTTNVGLNVGWQETFGKSGITTYFADVNADGKPDIVKNGRVWFNNTDGGNVEFKASLRTRPSPSTTCDTGYYSVAGAAPMNDSIFDDGHASQTSVNNIIDGEVRDTVILDTLHEKREDTAYRSAIRVWIAQDSGDIHISGAAMLDTRFMEAIARTNADGVHVSIQHNGSIVDGTSQDLDLSHPGHDFSVDMTVKRGDRIYFRVEALKNDLYDVVDWSPVIFYTDAGKDTIQTDSAGRKKYVFSARDDFMAWQKDKFHMPLDGRVRIEADYCVLHGMEDSIFLRIRHMDKDTSAVKDGNDTMVAIAPHTTVDPADGRWSLTWSLDSSDVLLFTVHSNTEQDWTALQWHPRVVSDSLEDADAPSYIVMNDEQGRDDTVYTIDLYSSPSYSPYEDYTAGWDSIPDSLIGLFRSLYRGWGAFTYTSDTMRMPMDETLIRFNPQYGSYAGMDTSSFSNGIAVSLFGDTSHAVSSGTIQSGLASFVPNSESSGTGMMDAVYDEAGRNRIWVACGYRSFVSPTQTSLYNWRSVRAALNDTTLLIPVTNRSVAGQSPSGGVAVGPVKGSIQEGYSVHASLSAGVQDPEANMEGSGCANYSHGESHVTADFVDMNGDGYPDIVGPNDVQYTNSRGGLSDKRAGTSVSGENGIQHTVYNAYSLQGGASFAAYEKHGKARGKVHIEQRSKGASLSQSKTIALSTDRQELTWMDMNGDGLPDCVKGDLVYLNLGYSYFDGRNMGNIRKTENTSTTNSTSGTLDISTGTSLVSTLSNTTVSSVNKSFSGGKTVSRSSNDSPVMYADINGDGLVDKLVDTNGQTEVYFNTGWGFSDNTYTLSHHAVSHGSGYNVDYNGNFTVGGAFSFCGLNLKLQGSLGGNIGNSISTSESLLMDMNADGLPDMVSRSGQDISVRYNQLYDVDKLTSVESFYGNRMELDYAQAKHSSRSRQRPTVMAGLTVEDLTDTSSDIRQFTYDYAGYVYSTAERTPYGFDSVTIIQHKDGQPYRITRQSYRTDHYKMRGKKASELLTDAGNRPYVKQVWNYELKQISDGRVVPHEEAGCFGATWPALDSAFTLYYDPATRTVAIRTAERYIHQDSGRMSGYDNLGDLSTSSDDNHCSVVYTRRRGNQSALPKMMTVTDDGNNMLRRRAAKYNDDGMLSELTMHNDGNDTSSVTNYSYDGYGNPRSVEMPPNDSGQRTKYLYEYDTLLHQFRISTTDSVFGLESRTEYDVRLGVPLCVHSVGGDNICYSYDDWGRPLTIRAPQESDTGGCPTIQYAYWDDGQPAQQFNRSGFRSSTDSSSMPGHLSSPQCSDYTGKPIWAQTLHRSQKDTSLDVATVLFADGHGRVLQTRRTAVVDGVPTQVASGHALYDDLGRAVTAYEPFMTGTTICQYAVPPDTGLVTLTQYDILDRVLKTEIPSEGIVTLAAYNFDSLAGTMYFKQTTTDPNGHTSTALTDARNLIVANIDALGGRTLFQYDALGQMLSYTDPDTISTTFSYNMLGMPTERLHPDAGRTAYTYDPAGHLTKEVNPLGSILYKYRYHRLTDKQYPADGSNDVHYTYGLSGRDKGLVTEVTDGSGRQRMEYDEMGRVSKSVRTLSIPNTGQAYEFAQAFSFDSWNRLMEMTYPDSEIVVYRYNAGGDLVRMTGDKHGDVRIYIDGIQYNKYGARTGMAYGNGSLAEYSYDPLQRLVHLHAKDGQGNTMQDIHYTYDPVGNITVVSNEAPPVGGLGGGYQNVYVYDALNRLTQAGSDGAEGWNFNHSMRYSRAGRLEEKNRDWESPDNSGSRNLRYMYSSNTGPRHAPGGIMDMSGGQYDMDWDRAGNLVRVFADGVEDTPFDTRCLFWTADSRLATVVDNSHYSYYAYGHDGERVLKMTGEVIELDQNASLQSIHTDLDNVAMYPSPYLVVTGQGYTKHYYAGAERVCARIGSGGLGCDSVCVVDDGEVSGRTDDRFVSVLDYINGYDFAADDSLVHDPLAVEPIEPDNHGGERPDRLSVDLVTNPWSTVEAIMSMANENLPPGNTSDEEPEVYFYHSDHLGSANWITDADGNPVQHLQYMPFGEPFINQRTSGYNERYTFTGKGPRKGWRTPLNGIKYSEQRDEETGYGYFGARYMDHEQMTMWLSVNPMADKYPSISPYAYCAWNPVKLVDPDGEFPAPIHAVMVFKACMKTEKQLRAAVFLH